MCPPVPRGRGGIRKCEHIKIALDSTGFQAFSPVEGIDVGATAAGVAVGISSSVGEKTGEIVPASVGRRKKKRRRNKRKGTRQQLHTDYRKKNNAGSEEFTPLPRVVRQTSYAPAVICLHDAKRQTMPVDKSNRFSISAAKTLAFVIYRNMVPLTQSHVRRIPTCSSHTIVLVA